MRPTCQFREAISHSNGPRPAEVVDVVRALDLPGVLGNTDELLWKPEMREGQEARMLKLRRLLYVLFEDTAEATRERLGEELLQWMQSLPAQLSRAGHGDPCQPR